MKWIKGLLVAALLLGMAAAVPYAQTVGGTLVYTASSRQDVTTNFATSATSAATITISPPGNQYVYITGIEVMNCAGTTVTSASPLSLTTTGLGGGTTPVWTLGTTGTAGMCNPAVTSSYYIPIKSNAPGTNVTFVLPTFTTQQTVRVNVWYYFAS